MRISRVLEMIAVGAVIALIFLLVDACAPRYDWGGLAKGVGRVQEGK